MILLCFDLNIMIFSCGRMLKRRLISKKKKEERCCSYKHEMIPKINISLSLSIYIYIYIYILYIFSFFSSYNVWKHVRYPSLISRHPG